MLRLDARPTTLEPGELALITPSHTIPASAGQQRPKGPSVIAPTIMLFGPAIQSESGGILPSGGHQRTAMLSTLVQATAFGSTTRLLGPTNVSFSARTCTHCPPVHGTPLHVLPQ